MNKVDENFHKLISIKDFLTNEKLYWLNKDNKVSSSNVTDYKHYHNSLQFWIEHLFNITSTVSLNKIRNTYMNILKISENSTPLEEEDPLIFICNIKRSNISINKDMALVGSLLSYNTLEHKDPLLLTWDDWLTCKLIKHDTLPVGYLESILLYNISITGKSLEESRLNRSKKIIKVFKE